MKTSKQASGYKHGQAANGRVSPTYHSWRSMIQRCENPNHTYYHYYGGRGIRVHAAWHDFQVFLADIGLRPTLRHTLDRKDNEGDYTPDNCRWATRKEQHRNTRNHHLLSYQGETHPLLVWAERYGLCRKILRVRVIDCAWPLRKALTTLVKRRRQDGLICSCCSWT